MPGVGRLEQRGGDRNRAMEHGDCVRMAFFLRIIPRGPVHCSAVVPLSQPRLICQLKPPEYRLAHRWNSLQDAGLVIRQVPAERSSRYATTVSKLIASGADIDIQQAENRRKEIHSEEDGIIRSGYRFGDVVRFNRNMIPPPSATLTTLFTTQQQAFPASFKLRCANKAKKEGTATQSKIQIGKSRAK